MFEIGSSLRQARQHRGLELADVERETRIRAKYLAALEDERFEVLPGQAYVRGFMRTYADFLGLNANLYVDEYNERFAPPEEDAAPIQHRPIERRELRLARPVAIALAALVGATVLVWQLGFSSGPKAPVSADRLVTTTTQQQTTTNRRPIAPTRETTTKAAPATLVVRATRGDCWVAVRMGSSTGAVVYEQVLVQGGTLRFGLKKPLWVRLGAPWNTDVTLRGKPVTGLPRQPVDLTAT